MGGSEHHHHGWRAFVQTGPQAAILLKPRGESHIFDIKPDKFGIQQVAIFTNVLWEVLEAPNSNQLVLKVNLYAEC